MIIYWVIRLAIGSKYQNENQKQDIDFIFMNVNGAGVFRLCNCMVY
jgi:hypothetical protein